jgi:tight adherence protein C
MPYSLLLGIVVGLSVLFFWLGLRAARSAVSGDDQLARYLDDNPGSLLADALAYAPNAPSFMERVMLPAWRNALQQLGRLAPSYNVDVLAQRLETAGRPHGLNVLNFLGLKFIAALITAMAGFALFVILLKQPLTSGLLFLIIFAVIGFYLPNVWLGSVIRGRKHAIVRALPDALDMIVVSTEAGQAFDQALRRVGEYWATPLTEEFNRILVEMQLGRTRREALTSASERIQLAEMSNLIAAIIQADELGVSIGKVLRIQADQLRTIRRQRAEELAHQAAIKLLFPLVFLVFPAMLAVLLGPAIPLILETFSNLGGG